jgi:hypothetical protein
VTVNVGFGDMKLESNSVGAEATLLTLSQVRQWVVRHHEYFGRWPGRDSGPIFGVPGMSWSTIDRRLKQGRHGLAGGSSLSEVVKAAGGNQNLRRAKPELTIKQILEWADQHHMRTGSWPTRESGAVLESPSIAWGTIEKRLRAGGLNHAGGMSLARLLRETRGVWDSRGKARLTHKIILKWADLHYARTGKWPVTLSGPVQGQPGENWAAVDMAMRNGRRGLSQRLSLSQLLTLERAELYDPYRVPLSIRQVLAWAQAHHRRTGRWPTRKSGTVHDAPGSTWGAINAALERGGRGLPGGSSLSRLLRDHFAAGLSTQAQPQAVAAQERDRLTA